MNYFVYGITLMILGVVILVMIPAKKRSAYWTILSIVVLIVSVMFLIVGVVNLSTPTGETIDISSISDNGKFYKALTMPDSLEAIDRGDYLMVMILQEVAEDYQREKRVAITYQSDRLRYLFPALPAEKIFSQGIEFQIIKKFPGDYYVQPF